ncbi:hypothetical protein V2A84_22740 [Yersinia sp. 2553 StPb PI]|uniref:hypothetical protein n=1 Tax=Yersinia sp. 2553 StPb PI TaxID=3117411 RepID=UPI003FA4093A
MQNFSIVVNNKYLELGLFELLNHVLQKSGYEGAVNVEPQFYSENDFLFIDVSNIDRFNVLSSAANSILFDKVFIITSRYDYDFNRFFIEMETKGKVTLLCFDDPLSILEKKSCQSLSERKSIPIS